MNKLTALIEAAKADQIYHIVGTNVRDNPSPTILELCALFEKAASLLETYRHHTPLGHQPCMVAEKADTALAAIKQWKEQP